jgi:citrate lyase subunit beta/citryl-CoA lyase
MAIHPKQIAPIRAAFAPSESEISWAKRVDLAFREAGAAGVVKLEGRMLDRPHLRQAQRILHAAPKA